MANYEGRRCSQGAEAPCLGGLPGSGRVLGDLNLAPELPRIRLEHESNRFLVRRYDFWAPPLDVFVMVPFYVGYRRGERGVVGERSPVELLRPDMVARREVPRLDESACAISFDYLDILGELLGRRRADDEVDMVREYVAC